MKHQIYLFNLEIFLLDYRLIDEIVVIKVALYLTQIIKLIDLRAAKCTISYIRCIKYVHILDVSTNLKIL